MDAEMIYWAHAVQNTLNRLGGGKIRLELVYEPTYGYVLYSRTQFEDHPDPKMRPRMQCWSTVRLMNRGLVTAYQVAQHILGYWEGRRKLHQAKMSTTVCDCNLGGAHETWCHKWEAY